MIDNDFKEKCSMNYFNKSIQQSMNKIDHYLEKFSSFSRKKNLAKVEIRKLKIS